MNTSIRPSSVAISTAFISGTDTVVLSADHGVVHLPAPGVFETSMFAHAGPDLVISSPEGVTYLVKGFFVAAPPPNLVDSTGTVVSGHDAAAYAGPDHVGVYAQAGGTPSGPQIGQVRTLTGDGHIVRVDGTIVPLKVGTPLFLHDVIDTDANGIAGVVLVDGTTVAIDTKAELTLDELVYDPASHNGSESLMLVSGAATFVSGQIAKSGQDHMIFKTPAAHIGIRGTKVYVAYNHDTGEVTFLNRPVVDANGNLGVGKIALFVGGQFFGEISTSNVAWQFTPAKGETPIPLQFTEVEVQQIGGRVDALVSNLAAQVRQEQQQQQQQQTPGQENKFPGLGGPNTQPDQGGQNGPGGNNPGGNGQGNGNNGQNDAPANGDNHASTNDAQNSSAKTIGISASTFAPAAQNTFNANGTQTSSAASATPSSSSQSAAAAGGGNTNATTASSTPTTSSSQTPTPTSNDNTATQQQPLIQQTQISVFSDGTTASRLGTTTFTIERTSNLDQTTTITYTTKDGDAHAGIDYTPVSGSITFAPGQSSATVTVPLLTGDNTATKPETFSLVISAGPDALVSPPAVATVAAPTVGQATFSVAGGSVNEGQTATITISRGGDLSGQVSVHYATQDGSAHAGADYSSVSGDVIFAAGETSKTITIGTVSEPAPQPARDFSVVLSNPGGGSVAIDSATVSIAEVTAAPGGPVLNIDSVSTTDTVPNTAAFTVTLSAASTGTVTVNYATAGNTAISGTDFTPESGTLTFAPGVTTQTISVPILADSTNETTETFTVALSNPSGATINSGTGQGTILADAGGSNAALFLLAHGFLPMIAVDNTNPPGGTIGSLLNPVFLDLDPNASLAGVAVVVNDANPMNEGSWQYSTDGGSHWHDIGAVANDGTALLLSTATLVRYVPVSVDFGQPPLQIRAIDSNYHGAFSTSDTGENRVTLASAGSTSDFLSGAVELILTGVYGAVTFDGNSSNSYADPLNWNPSRVPDGSTLAIIDNANVTVNNNSSNSAAGIRMSGTSTLTIDSTGSSTTTTLDAGLGITTTAGATINISNGTLTTYGELNTSGIVNLGTTTTAGVFTGELISTGSVHAVRGSLQGLVVMGRGGVLEIKDTNAVTSDGAITILRGASLEVRDTINDSQSTIFTTTGAILNAGNIILIAASGNNDNITFGASSGSSGSISNLAGGTLQIDGSSGNTGTRTIVGGIDNTGTITVNHDVTFNIGTNDFDNLTGGQFSVAAGITATFTGTDSSSVTNDFGATFTINGTLLLGGRDLENDGTINGTGRITMQGGTYTNTGTSSIDPGNSPGHLTIDGNAVFGAGSHTQIQLAGTEAGQFDIVSVTGHFTLGGAVDVEGYNGFAPHVGDSFHVMDWGSATGAFDSMTGLVSNGVALDPEFDDHGLTLVARAITQQAGSGDETLVGNAIQANVLVGGSGHDTLIAGGGDDLLIGGSGNTTFVAGPGNDHIVGGSGTNTADFSHLATSINIDLGQSTATTGTGAHDSLIGIQNVTGTSLADRIIGNAHDNVMVGGLGADTLSGGGGHTTFQYNAPAEGGDTITNFQSGHDVLGLLDTAFGLGSKVKAGDNYSAIQDAFTGTNAGTNAAFLGDHPALIYSAHDSTLYYDPNGAAPGYTIIAHIQPGAAIGAADIHLVHGGLTA